MAQPWYECMCFVCVLCGFCNNDFGRLRRRFGGSTVTVTIAASSPDGRGISFTVYAYSFKGRKEDADHLPPGMASEAVLCFGCG